jgi:hypothetical protein
MFGGIANVKNKTFEASVPDIPAGNRDSLANIHEVGRGIATDLETTRSQGRIKIGAYRAFAVRSRDKDTLERALGVREGAHEGAHGPQAKLVT